MPQYTYTKVYAIPDVNWNYGGATNNGVPIGTTFTVANAGGTLTVLDDDLVLEDNINVAPQSLDASQQTLVSNFGDNEAGDYVWSRAYQDVQDQYGNVGRIYQIRISDWTPADSPTLPDNVGDMHTYYAFTGPLVVAPGVTYTVLTNFNNVGNQPHQTFTQPVCFGSESLIETDAGLVQAGRLTVGSMVRTRDNGLQPVLWIARRKIGRAELDAEPNLRPIRICAGALGNGMPETDLIVSPQHRMLVRSKIAQKMFGAFEVLIAAKHLCQIDGIDIATDLDEVTYVHFLFSDHQIVFANGAEAESLYTGPEALKAVSEEARAEILTLFPELTDTDYKAQSARIIPSGKMAKVLARRHAKNEKPLCLA